MQDQQPVSVTFVGDADVVSHIIPLRQVFKSTKPRKNSSKVEKTTVEPSQTGVSDDSSPVAGGRSIGFQEQLSENDGISGRDIFQFRTPKKSTVLKDATSTPTKHSDSPLASKKKVVKASTPSSKQSCHTPKHQTPKGKISTPNSSNPRTPESCKRKSAVSKRILDIEKQKKPEASTPYRLRKRIDYGVRDYESSDESVNISDDDSDENVPPEKEESQMPEPDHKDLSPMDYYFDVHNRNANVTSDRTLAKLGNCKMDPDKLQRLLQSAPPTHPSQCADLVRNHNRRFNFWMTSFCVGFNILLYGLGSKRNILEKFRTRQLSSYSHIVINGYFPSLTIKQILTSITEDLIGYEGSFSQPIDQLNFIKEHFSDAGTDVFLVIHNIDGLMLRAEKVQNILSQLALIKGFHIIASIDHINASLVWDVVKNTRYNWVWQDTTTFRHYDEETSYENSLLLQQTSTLALSSVTHVLQSLTPNARGIFNLFARYQLDHKHGGYQGIPFQDLYQRCREAFLVNSNLTLRTQLTEFHDHKLIRSKKGNDGTEYLYIIVDDSTLTKYLESQDETL